MTHPSDTPLSWDIIPEVAKWYGKFAQKIEIPFNRAVVYYAAMLLAKEEGYSAEQRADMFPKESPPNRRILLCMLEKIVAGENCPDIDKI